jgi:hypothetical protein
LLHAEKIQRCPDFKKLKPREFLSRFSLLVKFFTKRACNAINEATELPQLLSRRMQIADLTTSRSTVKP